VVEVRLELEGLLVQMLEEEVQEVYFKELFL